MKRLDQHKRNFLHKRSFKSLVMTLVTALVLAACGGGGDGQNTGFFGSLTVFEIFPTSGESGVDPSLPIEIRMSAPVVTSTVSGKVKVSVTDNALEIPVSISFSEGNTVLLLTPTGSIGQFPGNTQLKIELFAGIQSSTGLTLTDQVTSFFTTGQGGLGDISKPGVLVNVINIVPEDDSIPAIYYSSAGWFAWITFSECVPVNSLAANIRVTKDVALAFPSIEVPMPTTIQQSPFDQRTFYIYIEGQVDLFDEVELKILKTMEDCNGDALAGGSDPNVNQQFKVTYEANLF